jgi:hypothetical protein
MSLDIFVPSLSLIPTCCLSLMRPACLSVCLSLFLLSLLSPYFKSFVFSQPATPNAGLASRLPLSANLASPSLCFSPSQSLAPISSPFFSLPLLLSIDLSVCLSFIFLPIWICTLPLLLSIDLSVCLSFIFLPIWICTSLSLSSLSCIPRRLTPCPPSPSPSSYPSPSFLFLVVSLPPHLFDSHPPLCRRCLLPPLYSAILPPRLHSLYHSLTHTLTSLICPSRLCEGGGGVTNSLLASVRLDCAWVWVWGGWGFPARSCGWACSGWASSSREPHRRRTRHTQCVCRLPAYVSHAVGVACVSLPHVSLRVCVHGESVDTREVHACSVRVRVSMCVHAASLPHASASTSCERTCACEHARANMHTQRCMGGQRLYMVVYTLPRRPARATRKDTHTARTQRAWTHTARTQLAWTHTQQGRRAACARSPLSAACTASTCAAVNQSASCPPECPAVHACARACIHPSFIQNAAGWSPPAASAARVD